MGSLTTAFNLIRPTKHRDPNLTEAMDKIGEANKPFEARVEDMMEDERQNKKEQENADGTRSDDGYVDIDTKKFLMTEMKFGLDFVFRMSEPILPTEEVPEFSCKALVVDSVKTVSKADYDGQFFAMIFYPKDFTAEGKNILNLVVDLVASKELNLDVLLISTDSVETHRAWSKYVGCDCGGPAVPMLGDVTGEVARTFGVLDTVTHLAYNAIFLIDNKGFVQSVKVYGRGGLGIGVAGEVLDLVREVFSVDEEVMDTEDKEEGSKKIAEGTESKEKFSVQA